jgi:hypothetical protein
MGRVAVNGVVPSWLVLVGLDGGIVRNAEGIDVLPRIPREEASFGDVSSSGEEGDADQAIR